MHLEKFLGDGFTACLGSTLGETLVQFSKMGKGEEHFVIEEESSLCATECRVMGLGQRWV